MAQDHCLYGFNYNVEAWDAAGLHYETLAICRQFAYARGTPRAIGSDGDVRYVSNSGARADIVGCPRCASFRTSCLTLLSDMFDSSAFAPRA
jgi:hypothetical protein